MRWYHGLSLILAAGCLLFAVIWFPVTQQYRLQEDIAADFVTVTLQSNCHIRGENAHVAIDSNGVLCYVYGYAGENGRTFKINRSRVLY